MMTVITMQTAIQDAKQAGFSDLTAPIIAAIAMAESSLNSDARHVNQGGTVDRGILQINNYYHSEVSDDCAYDITCSFQQGFRISSGGTNFSPWTTYTSGAYQQYLGRSGQNQPTPTSGQTQQQKTTTQGGWQETVVIWGEHVAIFVMAIALILLGFYILDQQQINTAIGKGVKTAEVAAIA